MKTPHFWQSRGLLSTALLPASWLYAAGAWANRRCTRPHHAPLPVIAIGNLTAGGAGKTPTTLMLAALLRAQGHTPHILTRGYGGAPLTAHRVHKADDWRMVGDEALLLAAAAPTWVGRDRLASAVAAKNADATVLLCDDALQHHALHADLSLLVVDGPYGLGNGRVLPAGPLRETLATARPRIHATLLIGEDSQALHPHVPTPCFAAQIAPYGDIIALQQGNWLAFAGIGRPEKFYASLRTLGVQLVATQDFADHHPYSTHELATLQQRAAQLGARLITTEKDAVKLPPATRAEIATLPITLQLATPDSFGEWLAARLPTP